MNMMERKREFMMLEKDEELVAKAAGVFFERPEIKSNEGLTRKELRWLQNKGLVTSRLMMETNGWYMVWQATDKLKR